MSRGPGRIERAIEAIFDAEPDNAFSTDDLCWRVYRGINRVEKKHRVSVTRAAWKIAQRRESLECLRSDALGRTSVWFDKTNVMSYAMGRIKTDMFTYYHGNDPRVSWRSSESDLRKQLEPGGKNHDLVVPGGSWWHHARSSRDEIEARRAGDDERLRQVLAERAAREEKVLAMLAASGLIKK